MDINGTLNDGGHGGDHQVWLQGTHDHYALWVTYTLWNATGTIACGILMYAIVLLKTQRTSADIFIAGLCSGCIWMSFPCMMQCILNMTQGQFAYGTLACNIEAMFHFAGILVQFFSSVLLGFRNYYAIVHNKHISNSLAMKLMLVAWVLGFGGTVLSGHYSTIYLMPSGTYCFYKFNSPAFIFWFSPVMIVCIITVAILYWRIFYGARTAFHAATRYHVQPSIASAHMSAAAAVAHASTASGMASPAFTPHADSSSGRDSPQLMATPLPHSPFMGSTPRSARPGHGQSPNASPHLDARHHPLDPPPLPLGLPQQQSLPNTPVPSTPSPQLKTLRRVGSSAPAATGAAAAALVAAAAAAAPSLPLSSVSGYSSHSPVGTPVLVSGAPRHRLTVTHAAGPSSFAPGGAHGRDTLQSAAGGASTASVRLTVGSGNGGLGSSSRPRAKSNPLAPLPPPGTAGAPGMMTAAEQRRVTEPLMRVARRSALFVVIFILSWGTAVVASIYELAIGPVPEGFDIAVAEFGTLHSLVVPLVYGFANGRVRNALHDKWPRLCKCLRVKSGYSATSRGSHHGSGGRATMVHTLAADARVLHEDSQGEYSVHSMQRVASRNTASPMPGGSSSARDSPDHSSPHLSARVPRSSFGVAMVRPPPRAAVGAASALSPASAPGVGDGGGSSDNLLSVRSHRRISSTTDPLLISGRGSSASAALVLASPAVAATLAAGSSSPPRDHHTTEAVAAAAAVVAAAVSGSSGDNDHAEEASVPSAAAVDDEAEVLEHAPSPYRGQSSHATVSSGGVAGGGAPPLTLHSHSSVSTGGGGVRRDSVRDPMSPAGLLDVAATASLLAYHSGHRARASSVGAGDREAISLLTSSISVHSDPLSH